MRRFLVLLTTWALCAPAVAQTQTFAGQLMRGMVAMKDARTGRTIISPNSQTVVNSTTLNTDVQFTPAPDGFDLTVTYTNSGPGAAPLGEICLPGLHLAGIVACRDFRADAKLIPAEAAPIASYPSSLYSPVVVVCDKSVTVGVSLLYPLLEYQHEVEIQLAPASGIYAAAGSNWEVHFRLKGDLAPGQTRRYDLAVRATTNAADWVRTLAPYRTYFVSQYQGVHYARDPRPVSGLTISSPECQSLQNPMGFCAPYASRPDTAGWVQASRSFKERPAKGYHRMMLWRPTGLFREHADLNSPFRFMTRMNDIPVMHSSLSALQSIPGSELDVGYWWGNSSLVMDGWDNGSHEKLDPRNPAHSAKAFAELDMAAGLGATVIGMDAFVHMPVWDACLWLDTLRQRAPKVKFVIERGYSCPDILHAMGPTWVNARDVTGEKTLADLLLPGHETWCGLGNADWQDLCKRLGRPIDDADRDAEIKRVAALGYVPVIFDDYSIAGREFAAAESWLRTIPADLLLDQGASALLPPEAPPPAVEEQPEAPGKMMGTGEEKPAAPTITQAPAVPEPGEAPAIRFSPRNYQRNQVNAAIDRMRISTFTKPRHRVVATEARSDKPPDPKP